MENGLSPKPAESGAMPGADLAVRSLDSGRNPCGGTPGHSGGNPPPVSRGQKKTGETRPFNGFVWAMFHGPRQGAGTGKKLFGTSGEPGGGPQIATPLARPGGGPFSLPDYHGSGWDAIFLIWSGMFGGGGWRAETKGFLTPRPAITGRGAGTVRSREKSSRGFRWTPEVPKGPFFGGNRGAGGGGKRSTTLQTFRGKIWGRVSKAKRYFTWTDPRITGNKT